MLTRLGIEKAISGEMKYEKDPVEIARYYKCIVRIDLNNGSPILKIYDEDRDLISVEELPSIKLEDEIELKGFLTKQIMKGA